MIELKTYVCSVCWTEYLTEVVDGKIAYRARCECERSRDEYLTQEQADKESAA